MGMATPASNRTLSCTTVLAGVAKPSSDAVDGQVNGTLHAIIVFGRALASALYSMAMQQLDLQIVQGIDVGKAFSQGGSQRGIV